MGNHFKASPRHGRLRGFLTAIAAGIPCWLAAQEPPALVQRPIQVVWGSYRNNEDLVDGGASQWTFVQQHMDAYLLHGAYWDNATNSIGSPSPDIGGPKLAALVNEGNKKVILEHLLGGDYPGIDSAFGTSFAGNPTDVAGFGSAVSNIKRLEGYGFPRPDVSTDCIMTAWQESVRYHPEWTSKEFFTALTGSWETYDGTQFDPAMARAGLRWVPPPSRSALRHVPGYSFHRSIPAGSRRGASTMCVCCRVLPRTSVVPGAAEHWQRTGRVIL